MSLSMFENICSYNFAYNIIRTYTTRYRIQRDRFKRDRFTSIKIKQWAVSQGTVKYDVHFVRTHFAERIKIRRDFCPKGPIETYRIPSARSPVFPDRRIRKLFLRERARSFIPPLSSERVYNALRIRVACVAADRKVIKIAESARVRGCFFAVRAIRRRANTGDKESVRFAARRYSSQKVARVVRRNRTRSGRAMPGNCAKVTIAKMTSSFNLRAVSQGSPEAGENGAKYLRRMCERKT